MWLCSRLATAPKDPLHPWCIRTILRRKASQRWEEVHEGGTQKYQNQLERQLELMLRRCGHRYLDTYDLFCSYIVICAMLECDRPSRLLYTADFGLRRAIFATDTPYSKTNRQKFLNSPLYLLNLFSPSFPHDSTQYCTVWGPLLSNRLSEPNMQNILKKKTHSNMHVRLYSFVLEYRPYYPLLQNELWMIGSYSNIRYRLNNAVYYFFLCT